MTKRTIAMAGLFLVGCAVGGVSSQLVVPRASAQQAATLTRWEYTCVNGSYDYIATDAALNPYGAQGWELQGVTFGPGAGNTKACFKRPKM